MFHFHVHCDWCKSQYIHIYFGIGVKRLFGWVDFHNIGKSMHNTPRRIIDKFVDWIEWHWRSLSWLAKFKCKSGSKAIETPSSATTICVYISMATAEIEGWGWGGCAAATCHPKKMGRQRRWLLFRRETWDEKWVKHIYANVQWPMNLI